ncbi:MAG: histidine phosphatase family protein [Candidatus Liptonbacteria bacterium]|nr:histidine phosphatase family protein [Candidatus Liptonbacteria bacterium]
MVQEALAEAWEIMHIYFIRHGQTTGDIEDRYGGDYDDHLTERGRSQAEELAEKLKDKGIEAVLSSPLLRARETAEILAKRFGCAVTVKQHLKERSMYGALTGMKREEAKKLYPELVELVKNRMNTLPGAEMYEAFSNRIQLVVREMTKDIRYECIAVVFHGGPVKVLFRDVLKKGEIGDVADCGFAEIETEQNAFKVKVLEGIIMQNDGK